MALLASKRLVLGTLMFVSAVGALSAEKLASEQRLPTEVAVMSMPPATLAQPVEVKVTSMPAMQPPQVRVEVPKDESARYLVLATWGLLAATGVLTIATFWVGWKQSRDLKWRDRNAVMREISQGAFQVMVTAKGLIKMAGLVPPARTHLHVLMNQGGMPPQIQEETEAALRDRLAELGHMFEAASLVGKDSPDPRPQLLAKSDEELTMLLWIIDKQQVRLEGIREDIGQELQNYERESNILRQQNTTLQAAVLSAKMSQPLKNTLG